MFHLMLVSHDGAIALRESSVVCPIFRIPVPELRRTPNEIIRTVRDCDFRKYRIVMPCELGKPRCLVYEEVPN
jgi:hypothetical protein